MKGTILDFIKLASENEELGRKIGELAAEYDFEFTASEEMSEDELGEVAGGLSFSFSPQIIGWIPPPPEVPDVGEVPDSPSTSPYPESWDKNKPPGG